MVMFYIDEKFMQMLIHSPRGNLTQNNEEAILTVPAKFL